MIKFPINKPIFLITSNSDIYLTTIIHAGEKILKCSFIYKKILIEEQNGFPSTGWMKMSDERLTLLTRSNIVGYSNISNTILINNYNKNIDNDFIYEQNIKNNPIKIEGYLQ